MVSGFDQLLSRYENGQMTRQELLGALSALVVTTLTATSAEPAVRPGKQLNHVTVFVQNVEKSVEFYQRLFGMPLLTRQDAGINLKAWAGFLGLYPAPGCAAG